MEGEPKNLEPGVRVPAEAVRELNLEAQLGKLALLTDEMNTLAAELDRMRSLVRKEVALAHEAGATWQKIASTMNMPRSTVHYHFAPRRLYRDS